MLPDKRRLELTALGPTTFRVSDSRLPADHASHVVAFVEAHASDVEIVWLRGCLETPGRFESMDRALESIEATVAPQARVAHSLG